MTREKVDAILNDLREEESRLKNELAELNKEMRETTKELKKIQAGIAGLLGQKQSKKTSQSKAITRKPSVRMVADLAAEVLETEGSLSEAILETKIAAKLEAAKQSISGLRSLLEKALREERFEAGLAGWNLLEHTLKASHCPAEMELA